MALFQPTNIIPSMLNGEGNGTVDVTKPLTISWQVNGSSPMVAYRIKIMQNDTESALKLDTGKVSLSSPFFGTDRLGNPRNYTVILPASQLATAGIINGYANGYKLTIQQWWATYDSIEQTSASFFITRNAPTVTLQIIPYRNDFRQLAHTFGAFYSQAQGDGLEWARWELQCKKNGQYQTIDDTGYIYHPGMVYDVFYNTLQYTFNGFIPGVYNLETGDESGIQYRIQCTVQTENGVQASTGWEEFTTQYFGSHEYLAAPILCPIKGSSAIKITMPKNFPILGVSSGSYSYQSGTNRYRLNLSSGSTVKWGGVGTDSLSIQKAPYSIMLKTIISSANTATAFFSANYSHNTLTFSYSSSGFKIQYGGKTLWENSVAPVTNATLGICLMDETVYFALKSGSTVTSGETSIPAWQKEEMQSITIRGPMIYDYIDITQGNTSWALFYGSTINDYASVTLATNTLFVCAFDHTLFSGDSRIGASVTGSGNSVVMIDSLCVCRRPNDSNAFERVATIPLDDSTKDAVIYDYSVKNQEKYQYYLLYMWDGNYVRASSGISSVVPCWWEYSVLCCTQNDMGDYIVKTEYRFALDVSSGNVGNNNSPTMQQNFTQYPMRQPVSSNYRSGSLGAFIGKVENDQYTDSVRLMDELYGLSTNGMTKFLKTRKGQIFRIETSAPVVMQIGDKYAQQPAKIALPWVEVGDASGVNILGDNAMVFGAPRFTVDPETMELIMSYNTYSSMGEDSFALSNQNLYLVNPGIYSESSFSLNSAKEVVLTTD